MVHALAHRRSALQTSSTIPRADADRRCCAPTTRHPGSAPSPAFPEANLGDQPLEAAALARRTGLHHDHDDLDRSLTSGTRLHDRPPDTAACVLLLMLTDLARQIMAHVRSPAQLHTMRVVSSFPKSADVPVDVECEVSIAHLGRSLLVLKFLEIPTPWKILPRPPGCPGVHRRRFWQQVGASFERFCLTAGVATLTGMIEGRGSAVRRPLCATMTARMGLVGVGPREGSASTGARSAGPRVRARDSGRDHVAAGGRGVGRGLAGPVGAEPRS